VCGDGCYDIDFDDGDKDKATPSKHISKRGAAAAAAAAADAVGFGIGQRVDAMWSGSQYTRSFPGTIVGVKADDKYDINFDDGDQDVGTPGKHIKPMGALTVGARVFAKWSRSKYTKPHPGTVVAVHKNNTYDINFDDGDKDLATPFIHLRLMSVLGEGTAVLAMWRQSNYSKPYPGRIAAVNEDGTYDIDFDDGDKDKNTPAKHVKKRLVLVRADLFIACLAIFVTWF
jgi:hypothetical protein